jgi:hypothetical protein
MQIGRAISKDLQRARAIGIPLAEQHGCGTIPREAEEGDAHDKLLERDGAVAVDVPIAEQVDDAHRVLGERRPEHLHAMREAISGNQKPSEVISVESAVRRTCMQ